LLAGSDPAVTILIEWMARSGSQVGVVHLPFSTGKALVALADGSVQVAGVHLRDPENGEFIFGQMRNVLGRLQILVVHFARWQIGLVTSEGNSRGITELTDLFRDGIRVINRERGSTASQALDAAIAEARMCPTEIAGYEKEVEGHLEVAAEVAVGYADAAIAIRMAAEASGLNFFSLREEY
jgi:putative molybdopterin biosynthesis protein